MGGITLKIIGSTLILLASLGLAVCIKKEMKEHLKCLFELRNLLYEIFWEMKFSMQPVEMVLLYQIETNYPCIKEILTEISVKYIITKTSKNLCPIHTIPLGLEIMLQPQEVLINPILKCIGSPSLENLYYILGDHGEISEWFVTKEDKVIAIPISKLHLIPDVRIAIIVKGNTVVIPTGNDCIEAGDHVILIAKNHIHNFNDIVTSAGGVASEFKNHIKKLRNVISM